MSQVDNYLKLVVREPQTEEDRHFSRLGRMVVHEIFPCPSTDGKDTAAVVLHHMFDTARAARAAGKTALVAAHDPGPFWHVARAAGERLGRIGELDMSRHKQSLISYQLTGKK
jgi:hypothetical protein